ncbi:MAG: FecR domain-containing protein [Opitutales bacterium]|nr:FecR domain-containing protein [Opitutales bacterium]
MNSPKNRSDRAGSEREQSAANWVVRHEYGLTAEEQDEFLAWLTYDPKNRQEYITQSWAWGEMDRLAGIQKTDHAPVNPNLFDKIEIDLPHKKMGWLFPSSILALAASLAVFLGVLKFGETHSPTHFEANAPVVIKRIEQRQFEDGSSATLNRGAVLTSHFTDESRLVKLLSGEASFSIEKDTERPFIVEARGIQVRAVGTEFNVRISNDYLDVVVSEGVVALSSEDFEHYESDGALIEANYRANIELSDTSTDFSVDYVEQEQLEEMLQWHPTLLEFDNAPLKEIITELNQRNEIEILLADPSLEEIRISSVIWSDNVVGFVGLLESYFGIGANQIDAQRIVLGEK